MLARLFAPTVLCCHESNGLSSSSEKHLEAARLNAKSPGLDNQRMKYTLKSRSGRPLNRSPARAEKQRLVFTSVSLDGDKEPRAIAHYPQQNCLAARTAHSLLKLADSCNCMVIDFLDEVSLVNSGSG